jgi:hypothetical protein
MVEQRIILMFSLDWQVVLAIELVALVFVNNKVRL